MAYKPEQEFQLELERERNAHQTSSEMKRARLDTMRLAKEVLVENARNKPAEESAVTAEEIITFAEKLNKYAGV